MIKRRKNILKRVSFFFTNPKIYFNLIKYFIVLFVEKIKGVDFTRIEQAPSLYIDDSKYVGYWSSSNHYLDIVLKRLSITSNDSILDIGCGKGHVLVRFDKYGFRKIAGLELTRRLYEIAKSNLEKTHKQNIEIYNFDAQFFDNYADYNYFYLYNPFHDAIMTKVIKKIEDTLITNPRKITIIYKNPTCHEVIIHSGIFTKRAEFNSELKTIKFNVYSN